MAHKDNWFWTTHGTFDPKPLLKAFDGASFEEGGFSKAGRDNFIYGEQHADWPWELIRNVVKQIPGIHYHSHARIIEAGSQLYPHTDSKQLAHVERYHWPLLTNKETTIEWPDHGVSLHMEVGTIYKINIWLTHAVYNRGKTDRLHLMADIAKCKQ